MGKIISEYNFAELEERNSSLKLVRYKCPHCTDENGKFADIVLYVPKRDQYEIATQCNCVGQEDRCAVLLDLMQSYNSEKLLNKILKESECK
ncbi:hypothetical protein FDG50_00475 [Clostridium botulinum]|uniref:hypothetical protein n=1 Tax=Clostridium botulinum TaxID=1491 RepID=UPI0013F03746|nr:hypothetical protein [Clostridium botulinum]MBY6836006.1 hypothetical protein [Clostridium botulinum]MBY6929775.1 hypothetical protein [Clostridium botulinum]NFF21945.1 hypothetical protein [Clostridium botulinum]NFF35497.1 hypothetical protein [Clostridium botulinum]NFG65787.1 hypothetical protein [Clostridium botulinum]